LTPEEPEETETTVPTATERKTRRKALQMMSRADGVPKDSKGKGEFRMADLFKKTGGYRKSVRAGQDAQPVGEGRGRERRTDRAHNRADAGRESVEDRVRIKTAEDRFNKKYDPELLRVARNRKRRKG
jgi:hypothetical protein